MAEVAKYLPSSEASAHMTRPSCPSMTLMSEWSRIDHSYLVVVGGGHEVVSVLGLELDVRDERGVARDGVRALLLA